MTKRIILVILSLIVLAGILAGIKALQINKMIVQGKSFEPPPETVTTAVAKSESWESVLTSVASIAAVQGVTVTSELSGKIVHIAFESGDFVQKGSLLVQLDTESEAAQLRGAEASVALTKINFERNTSLLNQNLIARSDYDNSEAQFKQALAQADYTKAIIEKKSIRAPFSGRLGIRLVNLGQILNEKAPIISLQSMDPVYINFYLPQQQLPFIKTGLNVRITSDALEGQITEGKITAINSEIDAASRNIQVQATAANPRGRLRPGMFANVTILLAARENIISIPGSAVLYAPYSDSVFIVEDKTIENNALPGKIVRQQFVTLGEKRGDFVSVITGLKNGDIIVSTGVFKLRNAQSVTVDNSLSPDFKLSPKPENN